MKLEINNRKTKSNHINTWRLNDTLLNEEWIRKEIRGEIKRFLKLNENRDMMYQNLWDTLKAVLREKYIALSVHIRKTEDIKINNLMTHLKDLEKQEQSNPKANRRQEITKIRVEINEIENKKYKESTKQEAGSLKRLTRLTNH